MPGEGAETCGSPGPGARRVIEANGGASGKVTDNICQYRIKL